MHRLSNGTRCSQWGAWFQAVKAVLHAGMPSCSAACTGPALYAPFESAKQTDASIAKALRDTFKQVDDELLFNAEVKDGDRSGTTAVVVVTFDKVSHESMDWLLRIP